MGKTNDENSDRFRWGETMQHGHPPLEGEGGSVAQCLETKHASPNLRDLTAGFVRFFKHCIITREEGVIGKSLLAAVGFGAVAYVVTAGGPLAAGEAPKRGGTLTFMIPADAPPS